MAQTPSTLAGASGLPSYELIRPYSGSAVKIEGGQGFLLGKIGELFMLSGDSLKRSIVAPYDEMFQRIQELKTAGAFNPLYEEDAYDEEACEYERQKDEYYRSL